MSAFFSTSNKPTEIIHVAPYIPRECGIATYTKDLVTAINFQNLGNLSRVFAIDDSDGEINYPEEVLHTVSYNSIADYRKAAAKINSSGAHIVHLQHEFGLFGGHYGSKILHLTNRLTKKFVITFHTILPAPPPAMKKVVCDLTSRASLVITMSETARERLTHRYGVESSKIKIVHHGVPSFPNAKPSSYKKRLDLNKGDFIVSTFGLISRNKGLEYGIGAMRDVVRKIPGARYLIIGKTHPNVFKMEGESYLESLKVLAKKLGIAKNIIFVNRFLPMAELALYLLASDVYLTPYLSPDQISSGTLSYALAAGKPCISTPYTYAQEILKRQGILVPFKDSLSIADSILYYHFQTDARLKAANYNYRLGRKMSWSNVGRQHLALFGQLINKPVSVQIDNEKATNLLLKNR